MRNPFDDIDLEATAELPTLDEHKTTEVPSFPKMPEELLRNTERPSLDSFPKNVVSEEDKSATLPSFHTHMGEDESLNSFSKKTVSEQTDQIVMNDGRSNVPPVINNPKNGGNNKKKKQPKKGAFKKDTTVLNIVVTIITVIMNVLVSLVLFNITKFAAISQSIFLMINIGVLVALLLVDLLVILMIRTKMIYLFVMSVVILSLFVGVGGYGYYALSRVNKNVNKITGDTKEEEVSASLVIYSGTSGDPITDEKDLSGRKVGIATGTTTSEIAKKKLEADGVTPEYVESSGYTDLMSELIAGNIDCAVMPVSYQSQFDGDESLSAYLPDTQSILDFSDTVTSTAVSGADKDITKEPFTVLVTGENEGLADSIILMSVNPVSMKVTMTSIARDSYVPISCYGSSDKINSAHAASESCMVQTVENLMGINIDYTIEFNFASVIQVVDAVGGVDVTNEKEFIGQSWNVADDKLECVTVPAGENVHMNGQQALGFVRERYAFDDGDFARQRHQQAVIEAIISKVMASKSPQMFLDLLDAAGNNIKTNFTVEQMTGFINYALQKSKRYYNANSISGLFNFESSRVYGYAGNIWNQSLQMDLWIYRLYEGSIRDCANAIKRNLSLTETPDQPVAVSWSAANTYTPDPVSREVYDEARITDDGRPEEVSTPEPTEEPTSTPEPTYTPVVPTTPDQQQPSTDNSGSSGDNSGSDNTGSSGDPGNTGGSENPEPSNPGETTPDQPGTDQSPEG